MAAMERLADRYELLERLGEGGSATVWRALDTSLGVERAVKLVDRAGGPQGASHAARLHTEARAMAGLSHPGVVSVHDVGRDGARDFIVMDLVDGPALSTRLQDEGALQPREAVRLGVRVLSALSAAHASGIVHRDVKPGNILLDSEGEAWLCDFGIALSGQDDRHTRTGTALGSLPYMAPEQRRDARTVDQRADQYGLGCTLYEALTLSTPVDLYLAPGKSPRWAGVPDPLVAVLRRATAATPSDRYASAQAMSDALVRTMGPADPEPVPVAEPDWVTGENRRRRPHSAVWVSTGVLLLTLVVSFAVVQAMDQLIPRVDTDEAPVLAEAPNLIGEWMGTWAQQPGAHLVLTGTPEAYEGTLSIRAGSVERISNVGGAWDAATERLVLHDRADARGNGSYQAELDADGILRGQFNSDTLDEPVPFALVRTE